MRKAECRTVIHVMPMYNSEVQEDTVGCTFVSERCGQLGGRGGGV